MKPLSHCPQANEFLMPDDTTFTVKSVTNVYGTWQVELEQNPPGYSPTPVKPKKVKAPKAKWWEFSAGWNPGSSSPIPASAQPKKPVKIDSPHASPAVHDYLNGVKSHTLYSGRGGGQPEDTMLSDIMGHSGRAHPPKVETKAGIDSLKAQGWKIFYRGVMDTEDGSRTGKQIADQFRTGDHYSGSGIYGNGIYAMGLVPRDNDDESNAESQAKGYATRTNYVTGVTSYGATSRFALPPTAKIITDKALKGQQNSYMKKLNQEYYANKLSYSEYQKMAEIVKDRGRFAALRNYDAIDASAASERFFVILNRSILAVEDTDY